MWVICPSCRKFTYENPCIHCKKEIPVNMNPNGKLARYVYSIGSRPYKQTTLCAFSWRFIFTTAVYAFIALWLILIGSVMYSFGWRNSLVAVGSVGIAMCFAAAGYWGVDQWHKIHGSGLGSTIGNSLVGQAYKAFKGKFCPIITFKAE